MNKSKKNNRIKIGRKERPSDPKQTTLLNAERLLRESEERYRELLKNEAHAVIVYDAETLQFEEANQSALNLFGYSKAEFFPLKVAELSSEPKKTEAAVQRFLAARPGSTHAQVLFLKKKGGEFFPAEVFIGSFVAGGRKKIIESIHDLSKQQFLEKMIQLEKLAAIGQITTEVAHELNNPLGAILTISDILLSEAPAEGKWKEDLRMIRKSALRCKSIVTDLRGFTRNQNFLFETADIHKVIDNTLGLCEGQIEPANVRVVKNYGKHPAPPLKLSVFHVKQVFLNLILNSVDAMPGGGILTITVSSSNSSSVQITFSDTGTGIREEDLAHIFEPFFTTKEFGKGTGLGLSICQNILATHGGNIKASSAGPEKGAEFCVTLPIIKSKDISKPASPVPMRKVKDALA